MIKLRLTMAPDLEYTSAIWKVIVERVQFNNSTPTTVPNIGYGGYGWRFQIACARGLDGLQISLFRQSRFISTNTIDGNGECTIIPDGGIDRDYEICIHNFKDHPER